MADVVIIDYGVGNLLSVQRAFEHCGAVVEVSDAAGCIASAPRVVLPGVGAFRDGMMELKRRGLDSVIQDVAAKGTPLLGICLGMQILFDESSEHERTPGLGIVPGKVAAVPGRDTEGRRVKLPHIGWNALVRARARAGWGGTILENLNGEPPVYFVHSFVPVPANAADCLAECEYGGARLCASISRGSVSGCQFHPEKSGEVGLRILKAFLSGADR